MHTPDSRNGPSSKSSAMANEKKKLARPAELVEAIFAQWDPDTRDCFLRLLLLKHFGDEAGSHLLFAKESPQTAEFLIRYAGPPLTEFIVDASNLSEKARLAIAEHCE